MGDRPTDWDAARVRDFDEVAARYQGMRAEIGLDPLRPMPMTPEQVADLVARAHANTRPHRVEIGRRNRARRDRWRAAQGR